MAKYYNKGLYYKTFYCCNKFHAVSVESLPDWSLLLGRLLSLPSKISLGRAEVTLAYSDPDLITATKSFKIQTQACFLLTTMLLQFLFICSI